MSNPVFVTPDGIRWEDYVYYVIAVDNSDHEVIGSYWVAEDSMEWDDEA